MFELVKLRHDHDESFFCVKEFGLPKSDGLQGVVSKLTTALTRNSRRVDVGRWFNLGRWWMKCIGMGMP